MFTSGIQVGYLLTLAIGVMTIGSEYRHQTITATFLAVPRRGRVMGAKVISLLGIGAFYGVLSLAGAVLAGTLVLTAKGHAPFADSSIWRTLALSLLVLGLWALIGLGAGILIPNQVAALLISVAVAWIVEPVLGLVLALTDWGQNISPYLPSRATAAMLDTTGGGFNGQPVEQLSWWAGALVLAAYAAAMAGLGTGARCAATSPDGAPDGSRGAGRGASDGRRPARRGPEVGAGAACAAEAASGLPNGVTERRSAAPGRGRYRRRQG